MAQDPGGDKTEKPTFKRLRDARREGNVSKSRELTSTALLLAWLVGASLMAGFGFRKLASLFDTSLRLIGRPFSQAATELAYVAIDALLWITLPMLALGAGVALAADFLQVGPVATLAKIKPDLAKLSPSEGFKKMFSMDNLVELIKSVAKCAALVAIATWVLWSMVADLVLLPRSRPDALGAGLGHGLQRLMGVTVVAFVLISLLDAGYQKYSYLKKLRMSRRDIRQELKDTEGDPFVKQRRRQLHQEWSEQNMLHAVRQANVVVTNPTHIAVALQYEHGVTDLPVVVAKGEDHLAELIKRTAEEAGVPILQNVELARGLNERVALDDYIGSEFFDAVAEVLRWAEELRRDGAP